MKRLCVFVLAVGAIAQQPPPAERLATISGTVISSSGTPIANASVILIGSARPARAPLTSGTDGKYTITDITPGSYQLIGDTEITSLAFTPLARVPPRRQQSRSHRVKP